MQDILEGIENSMYLSEHILDKNVDKTDLNKMPGGH